MKKSDKRRQYKLSNNHSCLTATLISLMSKYFKFTISFPNKVPSKTLLFPKVKTIQTLDGDIIEIYSIIKKRIFQQRSKSSSNRINQKTPRLNFERRFELFHFLQDLAELNKCCSIHNFVEEHGGISGNFYIIYNQKILTKNEILTLGYKTLQRIYQKSEFFDKKKLRKNHYQTNKANSSSLSINGFRFFSYKQ
ncbi:hypothetical protein EDI_096070 [Entamoeba dispar SAW760]|uniref:Uncharacterized protein n=1 Tax=Entamoeba dispar (strain ATCC PRA-260 / SAW760) TaxID=370354 RepID=B0EPP5_ENTDS|nr:uncharacterized protein EDI_096070 [Entamoeba dispar SAW760]EDR23475.1 hypothetical protein EDI_096070 [Entamoeba dispar SAW760]|eukprot:EDR23475.1 hypothetical protein EDI_096070 [Entamoeba dispar SAW760]